MYRQGLLFSVRLFVGGLFIFSGLIKVNDPVGTAIKLEEYFDVFSYDIASFFSIFKGIALELAFFLVVAEVLLGVMLILGVRLRFTIWAIGLMILFFTFLTFYSAYFDKVTDCGCFGDAIKLTPWESFIKDVVLLVLIGVLFVYRHRMRDFTTLWSQGAVAFVAIGILVLAVTAIRNLPFIDFRAYKEGVNIPQAMQPSEQLEYNYVMSKEGDEYVFDQYPADDSYEFVEMNLVNEDALPKISDFAVWNADGDYTDEILTGKKAVVLITNLDKMNVDNLDKIDQLIFGFRDTQVTTLVMAASSQEAIDALITNRKWNIQGYQGDATVIKTIMRSNPGILFLYEGTVLKKYHHRNTPDSEDAKREFGE